MWHTVADRRGAQRIFLERPEGKRLFGKPRHRWIDNIRTYFQEVGTAVVQWLRCSATNWNVAGSIPDILKASVGSVTQPRLSDGSIHTRR